MTTVISVFNLSVRLETDDYILHKHIKDFLEKYYTIRQKGFGPKGQDIVKVFAGKLKNSGTWQFHSTQFIHLYQHLKEINYPFKIDEKYDFRDYQSVNTDFKVRDHWVLREDQVPVVDFLIDNPVKSKLVPLATGMGKTLCGLYAIGKLRKRIAIVILSRFSDKWVEDVASIHDANTKDVMMIQGSKALASIINMAKENEITHDYFIFSAETLQSYITNYEEDPESTVEQYGCSPMELFPLLGIGIMLNDETHMSFHLIYKIIIYTNVEYQIGLTATLISDEHIVRRMHRVIYPDNCVYNGGQIVKYMYMYPIAYNIHPELMRRIKTSNYGSTNYSHTAFEQSILKNKDISERYFKIVRTVIEDYYDQHYMKGDKLVIFVSLVDMASNFVRRLKEIYPEKNVVRYCQEDAYDDMLEGDIIVSTPVSLGTGIDIPGLRVVISTVSISSTPVNIQMAGRLRKLKDRDVKYCYIYCENIPKQKQYHIKRVEIFRERANSISYRRSRVNIQ